MEGWVQVKMECEGDDSQPSCEGIAEVATFSFRSRERARNDTYKLLDSRPDSYSDVSTGTCSWLLC